MADTKISDPSVTVTTYADNLEIPVRIPGQTGKYKIPLSLILGALTPAQIKTLLAAVSWGTTDPGGNGVWINGEGAANGPLWIGPP